MGRNLQEIESSNNHKEGVKSDDFVFQFCSLYLQWLLLDYKIHNKELLSLLEIQMVLERMTQKGKNTLSSQAQR